MLIPTLAIIYISYLVPFDFKFSILDKRNFLPFTVAISVGLVFSVLQGYILSLFSEKKRNDSSNALESCIDELMNEKDLVILKTKPGSYYIGFPISMDFNKDIPLDQKTIGITPLLSFNKKNSEINYFKHAPELLQELIDSDSNLSLEIIFKANLLKESEEYLTSIKDGVDFFVKYKDMPATNDNTLNFLSLKFYGKEYKNFKGSLGNLGTFQKKHPTECSQLLCNFIPDKFFVMREIVYVSKFNQNLYHKINNN